jgi:hypothetical protein
MRTATTTAKAAADQNRSKLPIRLRDEAKLKKLPNGCRAGDNNNAFLGGFRLWEEPREAALRTAAMRMMQATRHDRVRRVVRLSQSEPSCR